MTKLNFLDVNVEDLSNKEMKDMIKDYIDSTGDRVKGYHDFNKSDLQNKIIEIYADFIVEDEEVSLTNLEKKMLMLFPSDNFYDGDVNKEDLEDLKIWTDCFLDETYQNVNEGKGVLSSLVKKEYVKVSGGKDSIISLNENAINFIIENSNISEIVSENKEEIKEEEKPKKKVSENKSKFIYVVKNPEGEIVEKFSKLKDVFNYAEMNGICTRGWVSLSIERNIPVLIGLGRDKEISEDFVPRVTKKYNGNYWKFEKETIGEEE